MASVAGLRSVGLTQTSWNLQDAVLSPVPGSDLRFSSGAACLNVPRQPWILICLPLFKKEESDISHLDFFDLTISTLRNVLWFSVSVCFFWWCEWRNHRAREAAGVVWFGNPETTVNLRLVRTGGLFQEEVKRGSSGTVFRISVRKASPRNTKTVCWKSHNYFNKANAKVTFALWVICFFEILLEPSTKLLAELY